MTHNLQILRSLVALGSLACTSAENPGSAADATVAEDGSEADAKASDGFSGGPSDAEQHACSVWQRPALDALAPDPPPECIPPCMWEALVACRVPELVERSCIYQVQSAPGESSYICSRNSNVLVEYRTVKVIPDSGGRPASDVIINYFIGGDLCLTGRGFMFSGVLSGSQVIPVARRWLDCAGNVVAEDMFGGDLAGVVPRTVFCGGRDAGTGAYPYESWPPEVDPFRNPACHSWRNYQGLSSSDHMLRFLFNESACQPGTCFPAPSATPADAGPAEASDGAFSDPDAFDAQIDADSGS